MPPLRTWLAEWATTLGRGGGFSATWTAPPPMIAPPQVQAQSFAKAIRTDISYPRSWPSLRMKRLVPIHSRLKP